MTVIGPLIAALLRSSEVSDAAVNRTALPTSTGRCAGVACAATHGAGPTLATAATAPLSIVKLPGIVPSSP